MPCELAVGYIADSQLAHAPESRAHELLADIVLTRIRRHEKRSPDRAPPRRRGPGRQGERSRNRSTWCARPRGRRPPSAIWIDPKHVDQPRRLRARLRRNRLGEDREGAVAQQAVATRPAANVRGDPDGIAESATHVAQPALDFGARAISFDLPGAQSSTRGSFLTNFDEIGGPCRARGIVFGTGPGAPDTFRYLCRTASPPPPRGRSKGAGGDSR